MDIIMFVDRKDELAAIAERLDSGRFELIIVYGRRRLGKTRLVLESVHDREHIYYYASETDNLRKFRDVAAAKAPGTEHIQLEWESLLSSLKDRIIIIDEFPNLIREDPSVVGEFQRAIDLHLAQTRTKLIILGSSVSVMGSKVLSYKSPLYGRKTGALKLGPIRFGDMRGFYPKASWREIVEAYGVSDGIPHYALMVEPPVASWLDREIRRPDSFLRSEIDFIVKYEFAESGTYRRILEAMAFGNTTPAQIRAHTGMRHSDITPYLRNLMEVELIQRELPVTENARSREGRYFIKDNLLMFLFRFIQPNMSAVEEGVFRAASIRDDFNTYLGSVFERAARQFVADLDGRGMLPFKAERLGRWWRKGEEIDVLAINRTQKKALALEVKWGDVTDRDRDRLMDALTRKTELTGLKGYEFHTGLVARKIAGKGPLMFDLDDFSKLYG